MARSMMLPGMFFIIPRALHLLMLLVKTTFDTFTVIVICITFFFFFFTDPATTEIYTLALHDALPIYYSNLTRIYKDSGVTSRSKVYHTKLSRSEEHTSELHSHSDLVCRLLLEKKK